MRMTINEFAEKENVSRVTVHKWIKDGKLKTELTPSGRKRIIGVNKELPTYLFYSDNQEDVYSKESFLANYGAHKLEIIKDDGLYRHLKLTIKDDRLRDVEIITYPGGLIVKSNLRGVYTFERTDDMFDFFRDRDLNINAGYYEEKCLNTPTINKGEGYTKEFVISLYAIVHAINLYDNSRSFKVVD